MKLPDMLEKMNRGEKLTQGELSLMRSEISRLGRAADRAFALPDNPLSWAQLYDTTLSVDGTFTFSGIPNAYRHLRIVGALRSDVVAIGGDATYIQFNGDTGNNYHSIKATFFSAHQISTAETLAAAQILVNNVVGASGLANEYSPLDVFIADYANSSRNKGLVAYGFDAQDVLATHPRVSIGAGTWASTAPVTSIKIYPATGTNWVAGSRLTVYGLGG